MQASDTRVETGRPTISVRDVMTEAADFMTGLRLPQMTEPFGLGQQYSYPSDAGQLTSEQLGTIQLQIRGWYSWTLRILGRYEIELDTMESVFDLAVSVRSHEVQSNYDKKLNKDELRALAIKGIGTSADDPHDLGRMFKAIITRRAKVKLLKTQVDIYHDQLASLSREQSRREAEARS